MQTDSAVWPTTGTAPSRAEHITCTRTVLWQPAHGGAGTTTLRLACGLGVEPAGLVDDSSSPRASAVVVTARTHAIGLIRAQELAYKFSAQVPSASDDVLAGLVLVADAPGRLPKPLAELSHLVSGGYPVTWWVPWVEAWRLGEPPSPTNAPKVLARMAKHLAELCEPIDLRAHPATTHSLRAG